MVSNFFFIVDIENKEYILHCGGVRIVAACLSSRDEDTVLSAMSTLMFLVTPQSKLGNGVSVQIT